MLAKPFDQNILLGIAPSRCTPPPPHIRLRRQTSVGGLLHRITQKRC
ncbi:hypothetical protein M6B38_363260 [Iris pallida]|uniref:Uncharacterized protein n=1 Tax=Iris pallida TaxID=29817 RepID=A0AAX6GJ90_IRIPA|nr:hypothetical protein M6B38_363260 [Iris pallida]